MARDARSERAAHRTTTTTYTPVRARAPQERKPPAGLPPRPSSSTYPAVRHGRGSAHCHRDDRRRRAGARAAVREVLGGRRGFAGAGGRAAGRRGVHGGADADPGARPQPALPRHLRQPLHGAPHPALRPQPREKEMAVGAEQPPRPSVRLAGSGRGDSVPSPHAARHEQDIPRHRLRDAEPRPGIHLRRRRLPPVPPRRSPVEIPEGCAVIHTYLICRFERVDLKCRYTRAKIMGTLLCLGGAITMSVLQSPAAPPGHAQQRSPDLAAAKPHRDWAVGCLCLLGAVLVLSGTTVLQAAIMIHFPAPFTLCSVTSLIGGALTGMFQVVTAGRLSPGTPQISFEIILSLVLVGGLVSSVCIMFQTWALEKKGPVVVSLFSPTQTVGSAIFSALFLGRVVQPTSMLGMVFLFSGLYIVLWAKKKEGQVLPADRTVTDRTANDMEKPLLFGD